MAVVTTAEPPVTESLYIVRGEWSADTIANSLYALLPARLRPIARHQFTLLDTFDGRVRRAGARLTRTGTNGTTVLTWQPSVGRGEVSAQVGDSAGFAWDLPAGPLQQAVSPVIGVRRLIPQADAVQQGSQLDVLDERGKTVARVRIESGHARASLPRAPWQPLPTTVTLTALRGYDEAFRRLVPIIESRPGLAACRAGAVDVILRHAGAANPGDTSVPRLQLAPAVRADAGARQIHRALLAILEVNEPGLRANLDSEFLHDFRVAIRRTRSLLGQIKSVFPADLVEHFATEFSWMGRVTGPPRDLDVLVLALRIRPADLSREDLDTLLEFLGHRQRQAHRELVEALNSRRYLRLVAEWHALLDETTSPATDAPNAARALGEVIAERAWRLSRRIVAAAEGLDDQTPAPRIHDVRILAKKLRYLIDVAPAFCEATDLALILGRLKKLQRVLGEFNDAQVQSTRLLDCGRDLAVDGGPSSALVALGRLAEERRQRSARLRTEVTGALARFVDRDARAVCRRALKRARPAETAP